MLVAEQQFRRIIGYRDLATLVIAIERHHMRATDAAPVAPETAIRTTSPCKSPGRRAARGGSYFATTALPASGTWCRHRRGRRSRPTSEQSRRCSMLPALRSSESHHVSARPESVGQRANDTQRVCPRGSAQPLCGASGLRRAAHVREKQTSSVVRQSSPARPRRHPHGRGCSRDEVLPSGGSPLRPGLRRASRDAESVDLRGFPSCPLGSRSPGGGRSAL
jgi:hypothetical protein